MDNINNQQPIDDDNMRHGKWIVYHNNDKLWFTANYVHGIINGQFISFDLNGSVLVKEYYKMGEKIGIHYKAWAEKECFLCLI